MTHEDKELLLRDLCARLPYKVIVEFVSYECEEKPWFGELSCKSLDYFIHDVGIIEIKPYLFPLSSMTEEQKKEFDQLLELELKAINDEIDPMQATIFEVDFYNKHHLDWRGLIPKGLAIDATGKNIY